jgi:hypothetical protein
MLQEVCRESLQVIMENSWVQRNFVLSNVDPPESLYTNILGESFILKHLEWKVALNEAQDVTGRLVRLGIDLKTEVETWENETTKISVVRGKCVEKPHKQYFSEDQAARRRDGGTSSAKELVRTKISTWVSDHFGIAVGIKVL